MTPLILPIVVSVVTAFSVNLFANNMLICKAGYAYQLYEECPDSNKPMAVLGKDAEICGVEVTTVIEEEKSKHCKPIYAECPVKTEELTNWLLDKTVDRFWSSAISGAKTKGLGYADYCKLVAQEWNRHYGNALVEARGGEYLGQESSGRLITYYKYSCSLDINTRAYKTVMKRDKSCEKIEGYEDCKDQKVKSCTHVAFAKNLETDFERNRGPHCKKESTLRFGFENTSINELREKTKEGLVNFTCLSCDELGNLVDKAECLVHRYSNYIDYMSKHQAKAYERSIVKSIISLSRNKEVLESLSRDVKVYLKGLSEEISNHLRNAQETLDDVQSQRVE